MSLKASKRKLNVRRGTDESLEDTFKSPSHLSPKKDVLNSSDEILKPAQIMINSDSVADNELDVSVSPSKLTMEENGKNSPITRSRSSTPKVMAKVKDIESEHNGNAANGNDKELNGKNHESTNGKSEERNEETVPVKGTEEMESLQLDAEDPELQFPEEESGSEIDFNEKGSPVLSRSVTRRSYTRNIPTPKTPKSVIDQNGADAEQTDEKINMNPVISVERLSPEKLLQKSDTEMEVSSQSSTMDSNSEVTIEEIIERKKGAEIEEELLKSDVNITIDSCVSASENNDSLLVNLTGDDATRNIDFSCKDSSVLDVSKEGSADSPTVRRSPRRLSSRRSIRPNSDDIYRRKAFHNQAKEEERSSIERGVKRRQRSTTPDGPKRYKLEPDPERSPGFLAYLSSPFQSIKNRFARTQLPASTPILKGFKPNPLLTTEEQTEPTETEVMDETNVIPEKRRCVIM